VRGIAYGAEHPIVESDVTVEIDLLKRHVPPPHLISLIRYGASP
jgi:hypothetical protein